MNCNLYAKIEDWPTTYSRVSISVKTADQVMFLEHGSAMRLGHRFIRQGDAVTLARGRWVLEIYPQSTESYWTAGGCLIYQKICCKTMSGS